MSTDLQATQGRDMATEGVAGQENPIPASRGSGWTKISDPGFMEWSRTCRRMINDFYIPQFLPNREAFASGIMGMDDINKLRLKYEAEKKKDNKIKLAASKRLERLLKDELLKDDLLKDDPPCKKPRTSDSDEDEDGDWDEYEDEDEDIEEETDLPLHSEK